MNAPPRHILVVDDDPDCAAMYRMVLEFDGYRVECAADGREALETIRIERPALVLLDVCMPHIDGWGVLARLRELPDPPLTILVSATADLSGALSAGASAALAKPFSVDQLRDACRRLLDRSA